MKKAKLTPFQLAAEAFALLTVAGTGICLGLSFGGLPEQIPSHFGLDGAPDAWNKKGMLIFVFCAMIGIYLLMTVVAYLPPRFWNLPFEVSDQCRPALVSATRSLICALKLMFAAAFAWIIYAMAASRPLGALFIVIEILLLILCLSTYFVRSFRISLADAREQLKLDTEAENENKGL